MVERVEKGGLNMHDEASAVHIGLTDYEAEQIALIAHWKGRRSPAIEELFNMVAGRVAHTVGKVVPDETHAEGDFEALRHCRPGRRARGYLPQDGR